MRTRAMSGWVLATAVMLTGGLPAAGETEDCFECTQVIGYSQVGGRAGGWYVVDGVFEAIVEDDRWQLLWTGGAGVDRWQDPNFRGWSNPIISRCKTKSDTPDRVLLSISGPYGANEEAWARAIEATIDTILRKLPSVRQLILQPVVGGPTPEGCAADRPGRGGGAKVRASWQHHHIENAIRKVVERRKDSPVKIVQGFSPKVRDCGDFADALGHLTREGAIAAARSIGEYYARLDERCRSKRK
jgi:hypothetical protein